MKIFIFNGPDKEFIKLVPNIEKTNFLDLINESDKKRREYIVNVPGQEAAIGYENDEEIKNLVVYSSDYASVAEHVIDNFNGFLNNYKINNLYIQNPPVQIHNKLVKFYSNITVKNYKYKRLTIEDLKKINKNFSERIIGQELVKEKLLAALYPLTKRNNNKPVVIMFYGMTGVGKTETAKFICEILKGKILRKQFSMFQNEEFSKYLFGGKYSQISFAKELLERESNVILLDEFDKANSIFYSAFYEIFDEGIMEDKHYKVNVNNAVIICTSNYKNVEDIKKSVGEPIYSRFDAVIMFNALDCDSVCKIIYREFENEYSKLSTDEQAILDKNNIITKLISHASKFKNVREIKNIIRETMYLAIVREIV